jgi:hypothetical protein
MLLGCRTRLSRMRNQQGDAGKHGRGMSAACIKAIVLRNFLRIIAPGSPVAKTDSANGNASSPASVATTSRRNAFSFCSRF